MTNEEAINILKIPPKCTITIGYDNEYEKCNEVINMAIEALEKQIPKKPIILGGNSLSEKYFECPVCWSNNGMPNQFKKYCRNCGQAIDWSDE